MKTYNFEEIKDLKHGENPHQKAQLCSYKDSVKWTLLQGSEMSYNNFLDASCALEIACEFYDVAATIAVKHENPCAVALGANVENAFDKILDCDPLSPFGATIAFTKGIDTKLAQKLSQIPIKLIIAPSFDGEGLNELKKNKDLKIVQITSPICDISKLREEEIKLTPFGALIQQKDTKELDVKTFKVMTKKKPEQEQVEDMIFAFKIAKHASSASAVAAKGLRTLGIASGQTNYEDAIEVALDRICDSAKDCVVALDGALSSVNAIQIMTQNRVAGAIQSAGSIKDNEIVEYANKYDISMISTGIRHYKH